MFDQYHFLGCVLPISFSIPCITVYATTKVAYWNCNFYLLKILKEIKILEKIQIKLDYMH